LANKRLQTDFGVTAVNGVYGYCSCCGTRNDVQELTLTRERIKAGEPLVP